MKATSVVHSHPWNEVQLPLAVWEEWAAEWYQTFSPQEENHHPLDVIEQDGIKFNFVRLRTGEEEWIIERPEYPAIWRYIKEAMARLVSQRGIGGLVIWGQPGIGKRLFLFYALALAIHEQRPAVWCDSEERIILFPVGRAPYALEGQTGWPADAVVFVDSTAHLVQPPAKFLRHGIRNFIVQATSPNERRYKGWAKEKWANLWPMDLWSFEELRALMHLLRTKSTPPLGSNVVTLAADGVPPRVYSAERLFELLGPSVRAIIDNLDIVDTGNPAADLASHFASGSLFARVADHVLALTSSDVNTAAQMSGFHTFFFAVPPPFEGTSKAGGYQNPLHKYIIPTKFLAGILMDTVQTHELQEQYSFALQFSPAPQVARALYEAAFIRMMKQSEQPLQLEFSDPTFNTILSPPLLLHDLPLAPHSEMAINVLYVPPRGFPSFDAYLLIQSPDDDDGLLAIMLQATIARKHDVPKTGIDIFLDALDARPDANKIVPVFVFVVPLTNIGTDVSRPFWNNGIGAKRGLGKYERINIRTGYAVMELPKTLSYRLETCFREFSEFPFVKTSGGDDLVVPGAVDVETNTDTDAISKAARQRSSDDDDDDEHTSKRQHQEGHWQEA
ncbi:hypothetical protein HMN09_00312400 [Mycena chlorophos]|uniref:Uncharacterized protein n=1 Tax=Mycena chlorophos TaxID=658473 RepID=A0A8H6WHP3_MYCCL|nr:hypothetical protein HMN09_00312400 [Mycena chlorophos]